MKVENVDLGVERKLLILLITNKIAAQKLLPILDKNGVKTNYARIILPWIQTYWETYADVPQGNIQEIFEQKKPSIRDEEVTTSISKLLESVAEECAESNYENIDFHIKDCEKYIRDNNLAVLQEKVTAARAAGDVAKAESLIANFTQKAIPESQGVSLMNDLSTFESSFSDEVLEPLFTMSGDIGKIYGNICRGELSATLSTSKAGKSWECQFFAESAMAAGQKVLVVNLEMRDVELQQRYWRGLVNAPFVTGPVSVPFFRPDKELTESEDDANVSYRIDHKIVNKQGVSFTNTASLMNTMRMRYKTGDIRLISMPAYATGWPQIESVLDNLRYFDGFEPSVLIVDYLDLMASKETEFRHRLNDIWSFARKVSLERNIHIHTVSQSNSKDGSNEGKEITLDSISEDQRKKSHVSLLVGMWASDVERQNDYIKMKRLVGRSKAETWESCVILQCLDCGLFHVASKLASKVEGV